MAWPDPTYVYHFTRVEHLASIIERGLVCDMRAQTDGVLNIEVGNRDIKAARRHRIVSVAPGGVVADYVPFYFAPQSPMLYSISRGNVPTYTDGTDRLVFLVSTVERLRASGLTLVVSDRNARNNVTKFLPLDEARKDEDFVDFELMRAQYWGGYDDGRERRMAECLVHGGVPWDAFEIVGTRSKTVADEVAALIGSGSLPRVEIAPRWYF
ncbi:type II toxin-antitoxin system toxin DNA ADP-ribosyl transferase DarT [Granulicoccus phenolivorans]|uniref:type II toxin-antitoxin system toxin DNA ADP-ribosyl transferase DarT n=1 Tax=Granulicoccus phenolivorans TaxID=266854 RepID=UPI00041EED66|nr:DUF4433 domain-containing protein [Granulicoccus phenolivorans]